MPNLHDRGDDIHLLARMFASDFSRRFMTEPITFSPDAVRAMTLYRWPGNVRQLKNITEQMSILSQKREIDAETLSKFIPENQESTQLTTTTAPGSHSYESEREILYKILYELRGNVSDLRREIADMRKKMDTTHALDNLSALNGMHSLGGPETHGYGNPAASIQQYRNPQNRFNAFQDVEAEEINDNENAGLSENDSLNLNDIGRHVVEKALERNGGNRKKAAQELGISDRTLYRRIKQYGLDKQ